MSEQLSRAVAAEVRRLCEELGWSGRELARRAGLKVTATAAKLAGETAFGVDDVDAIAAAIGISPVDLIARADEARPHPKG